MWMRPRRPRRRRSTTIEGDAELVAATRAALEEGVHQLADTVRNSLNFYRMQDSAETVERALLTGPAVADPRLRGALAEQLSLPVEAAVVGRRTRRSRATSIPGASRSPPASRSRTASPGRHGRRGRVLTT